MKMCQLAADRRGGYESFEPTLIFSRRRCYPTFDPGACCVSGAAPRRTASNTAATTHRQKEARKRLEAGETQRSCRPQLQCQPEHDFPAHSVTTRPLKKAR